MQTELNSFPKLFLVRHGATDWTDSRQHTGLTDLALNAKGERSAMQLKHRLALERFEMVFTSPLLRAKQTCELAGLLENAEVRAELAEWNYGSYEGLTTVAIQELQPDWCVFLHGAPSGETPEQVAFRADLFLEIVRSLHCNMVAFSSGHMIRMIAARWLNLPAEAGKYFLSSTASLSVLGYEHNLQEPSILLWNETQKSF
ncbi:MAG: histidine phosphatase family protein [Pirellula sp.]